MKENLVICDTIHKCSVEKCDHRIPHKAYKYGCDQLAGGTKLICHAGGLKSICVPIQNNEYLVVEVERCEYCYGTGTLRKEIWNEVPM